MQPPLTEPTASPSSVTSMEAPAGRGAERQVRTTVAIAALPPWSVAVTSSLNTSRTALLSPIGGAACAVTPHNGDVDVIRLTEVTQESLDVPAIQALVADPAAGAVVTFCGDVRNFDHGRQVQSLTYEGHPTAAAVLREVAQEIAGQFEIVGLAVCHRIGELKISDAALVAVVSTGHRGDAFLACQALVDLTKARLPVWKHQIFVDGTDEWVNCA